MTLSVEDPARTRRTRPPAVGWLVLVAWISLAVQTRATDYGASGGGPRVVWFVTGSVLLLLVLGGSRVARGITIIFALTGAVIYGFGAFTEAHAALLCAAFLGQSVPLLMRPVREYVQP